MPIVGKSARLKQALPGRSVEWLRGQSILPSPRIRSSVPFHSSALSTLGRLAVATP